MEKNWILNYSLLRVCRIFRKGKMPLKWGKESKVVAR